MARWVWQLFVVLALVFGLGLIDDLQNLPKD